MGGRPLSQFWWALPGDSSSFFLSGHTSNGCSTGVTASNLERSADHSGVVLHDSQSRSLVGSGTKAADLRYFNSDAVVAHFQDELAIKLFERNQDFIGLSMSQGVIYRFLGDVIQLRGLRVVWDLDGAELLKLAMDHFQNIGGFGEFT